MAADLSQQTPRVNGALMGQHLQQKVLLVGKARIQVTESAMDSLTVEAADGALVKVYLKAGSPPPQSPFAEFEGIVEQPGVLRNADHVDFGSAFDMGNYNELCKLAAGDERAVFRS